MSRFLDYAGLHHFAQVVHNNAVPNAPDDGKKYARKDGQWVECKGCGIEPGEIFCGACSCCGFERWVPDTVFGCGHMPPRCPECNAEGWKCDPTYTHYCICCQHWFSTDSPTPPANCLVCDVPWGECGTLCAKCDCCGYELRVPKGAMCVVPAQCLCGAAWGPPCDAHCGYCQCCGWEFRVPFNTMCSWPPECPECQNDPGLPCEEDPCDGIVMTLWCAVVMKASGNW